MASKTKTTITTTIKQTIVMDTVSKQGKASYDGLLRFGKGNAKLKGIWTFSIPAGWTCPQADKCLSKADRVNGGTTDGPNTEFRCFSASQEGQYPNVRDSRWHNFELLKANSKSKSDMVGLIYKSLEKRMGRKGMVGRVRIHVSGDFYTTAYFDAWCQVARLCPDVLFYAYTKSLGIWVSRIAVIPSNLVLTASYGGREDYLIPQHKLRSAIVAKSVKEAEDMGLGIDHDDSHTMSATGKDFALLVHGPQPKGSEWSKALYTLRAEGEYGYGAVADKRRAERKMFPLN